jgi:hypothetical protein
MECLISLIDGFRKTNSSRIRKSARASMKGQGSMYSWYSEAREPAKLSHLAVFSGSYAQHIARPTHSRDLMMVSKTGLRPDGRRAVSYRGLHDPFFASGNELRNSKMFPGGPVSVRVVLWNIGEVFRAYLQALLFTSQSTILPLRRQRRNHGYLGGTRPGTTGPVSRGSTA